MEVQTQLPSQLSRIASVDPAFDQAGCSLDDKLKSIRVMDWINTDLSPDLVPALAGASDLQTPTGPSPHTFADQGYMGCRLNRNHPGMKPCHSMCGPLLPRHGRTTASVRKLLACGAGFDTAAGVLQAGICGQRGVWQH